ncbi:uncharacterized protein BO87DRAFT_449030 [Aspergillus neoniger CBS 115656]|uniref:Uncharacterized protein n=1 Tax=Aspergillus neoniger (strain CBS 115656) TaxID=1448310 RepID=A0A318Y6N9_ASPNB|nr:hypothetical protein BO87DRAFT_449030 [Aspergillus neoniger CBS 115656]PYH29197.1 hypothetical protein BO87DRAFT_449030 [Aspergillus neoniger CBS 115656]
MNQSLDVHCTYPGKLLCTEYTDSTLLYIAASVGTPALLEAMFNRAPDQLHGRACYTGSCLLPGPQRVLNGQCAEKWYALYLLLNLSIGLYSLASPTYILHYGSKTEFEFDSFELAWEDPFLLPAKCLDVMDVMATRNEPDSPEATSTIQRCIEFLFRERTTLKARLFQAACLPSLLGNMGLRIRSLYLDKFYTVNYEEDLDELRYIIGWCKVALQKEI